VETVDEAANPISGRRAALWLAFYFAALLTAAAIGFRRPELAGKAKMVGALMGAWPLGMFALGGKQLLETRMQSPWRSFLPNLDRLPPILCFLLGLALVDVFQRVFSALAERQ
jgi:hypothetical protein